MNYYKVLFHKENTGSKADNNNYNAVIVKADNPQDAEDIFTNQFPDNTEDVFGIARFVHRDWMEPLEEMEVIE